MAEDSFPTLLKSFIIITLFAFLLVGFIVGVGDNYGKSSTEITDRIGFSSLNNSLSTAQSTAETWQDTFDNIGQGNIFQDILDILGLLSVGMFNLVKSMATFIFLPFAIIGSIMTNVLGVPVIVSNIINVLIILSIIFGIWSLIKRGV